jgi:hypothetical protein
MQHDSRHQCLIYQGAPSRHLERLAQLIVEKLRQNNRCLYLNSPAMVAGMRSWLSALGLDVASEVDKGALILSSDRSHLEDGEFNVEKMLATLQNVLAQALSDGYAGLWASGDMTWELGDRLDLLKLIQYEQALEEFMQKNYALSGICQYHRDTLPPMAVLAALQNHKGVRINETLLRFNPHYEPPRAVKQRWNNDLAAEDINRMLDQLAAAH